ncbi:lysoplasmalogenase [Szabonella alba]|nr:lysoplasmalogenase [Szabonella alba]
MEDLPVMLPLAAATAGLAALIYWIAYAPREGHGPVRSAVKTAAVGGLAVLAALLVAPWPITAGLALGALGDLALSRPGNRAFLAGMAAFALGHLAYAQWFLGQAAPPDALRLAAMAGLLALSLSTQGWLLPHTGALRPAVAAYVAVICAMGLAALASPNIPALAGAALFILSDLLLALALFRPVTPARRRSLSLALWPAYWLGQALILAGAVFGALPGGILPFHPAP